PLPEGRSGEPVKLAGIIRQVPLAGYASSSKNPLRSNYQISEKHEYVDHAAGYLEIDGKHGLILAVSKLTLWRAVLQPGHTIIKKMRLQPLKLSLVAAPQLEPMEGTYGRPSDRQSSHDHRRQQRNR